MSKFFRGESSLIVSPGEWTTQRRETDTLGRSANENVGRSAWIGLTMSLAVRLDVLLVVDILPVRAIPVPAAKGGIRDDDDALNRQYIYL
jgi:hypothetical protein